MALEKSTIAAIVYKRFFEKLRKKFFEEFCLTPDTTDTEESEEIWCQTYEGSKRIIAHDLFKFKTEKHFYRKYDGEVKKHIGFRYPLYPVTIDKKYFSYALKYLLFGKDLESSKDFPDFVIPKINDYDWEIKYDELLDLFNKKYFPRGIENVSQGPEKNETIDKNFLQVITANKEVFESRIIKEFIAVFFKAITDKDYERAWSLLSPTVQTHPKWNGNSNLFEASCYGIDKIEVMTVVDFTYNFQRAKFIIQYSETGDIYNPSDFLQRAKSDPQRSGFKSFEEDTLDAQVKQVTEEINLFEQKNNTRTGDSEEWLNIEFKLLVMDDQLQRYFFSFPAQIALIDSGFYSKRISRYKRTILTEFECEFFKNKWRISHLGAFEPALYLQRIDTYCTLFD